VSPDGGPAEIIQIFNRDGLHAHVHAQPS